MIKSMGNGWRSAIEAMKTAQRREAFDAQIRYQIELQNEIDSIKRNHDASAQSMLSTLQTSIEAQNAMRPLW